LLGVDEQKKKRICDDKGRLEKRDTKYVQQMEMVHTKNDVPSLLACSLAGLRGIIARRVKQ
jgi:hypothetical protein